MHKAETTRPGMGERTCKQVSKPRLRRSEMRIEWDEKLHSAFEGAVDKLGGITRAKAKSIAVLLQQTFPFITVPHVSSHLQKYRKKKGIHIRKNHKKNESNDTSPSTPVKRRVKHGMAIKQLVDEIPSSPISSEDEISCSSLVNNAHQREEDEQNNKLLDVIYALMTLEHYCIQNEMNY